MAKRLFIIDDDQEIRAILQELLEGEAYEGEIANDGLIAWENFSHQCERYEMGIRHALTKPFDLETLLALVTICRGEGSSSPTTARRSAEE
jgi:DNA-binding response OmpR family regulator